ncbi:MAG: hypothetical protein JXA44_07895 [Methanospirillaceae archaeon]|nr:hypothetical protein [Methanospirillaceae archaeon]
MSCYKKCFPVHLKAWLKRPVPETLITFCVGCRLGIEKNIKKVATAKNTPIIFIGDTPFEGYYYKTSIIKIKKTPLKFSKFSFIFGYIKQIIVNPYYLLNYYSVIMQIKEFLFCSHHFNLFGPILQRLLPDDIHTIHLFYSYYRWDEKEIERTITEKLNWKREFDSNSSYRGGCSVGPIKQSLYRILLGYNDLDDHLSCLIRDGQITREEALKRIHNEPSSLKEIHDFCNLNIDEKHILELLNTARR